MAERLPLVKVINPKSGLARMLPADGCWDNLCFTFDKACRRYDWLVVYDDLRGEKGKITAYESLGCPAQQTILITYEPAAVKIHGQDFVNQFHYVLSCHEEWALRHPNKIVTHPASPWWYRMSEEDFSDYEALKSAPPPAKTRDVSTVCSTKQQRHTLHSRRWAFTTRLKQLLPDLEWYGRGVRRISGKAEALDAYRCHIAVENHRCPHYWTEKLADAYLAYCLPVYYGCPNITDYFPAESLILIDIDDAEAAAEKIKQAIADNAYEKRLPYIIEARRRLLEEHNFFALIARVIHAHAGQTAQAADGRKIYSRRAIISRSPAAAVKYFSQKMRSRWRFLRQNKMR